MALGVSYSGESFHGWQFQGDSIATVQACLETALSKVADKPVRVACAGRTDSGVHATKQVVHFQSDVDRPLKAWVMGTNAHLPDSVSVTWSREVPSEFNARHSARARRYVYLIYDQRIRSALFPNLYTREHRTLDPKRMHEAAQYLLGENDFSSFRAANCQSRSPMRNIHHLSVVRGGDLVVIDVQANAFLHHMVRNIAGVLMDIGASEQPVSWTRELIKICDRRQASVTAAPNGLYLVDVLYPDYPEIPEGPDLPHLLSMIDLT
ncbi:MAG TPA: tRNA pseudouridine(38-40) synthase TruA [Gammaproteobacteria bacterium]|nr:tRNA pseudouridine(38-40) synthase TruA [Gammaproteobacteria bacterium]HIL95756.1 tRNA pseudouridine(38-40) synthase TruA [Pseudomonadales bacterium]